MTAPCQMRHISFYDRVDSLKFCCIVSSASFKLVLCCKLSPGSTTPFCAFYPRYRFLRDIVPEKVRVIAQHWATSCVARGTMARKTQLANSVATLRKCWMKRMRKSRKDGSLVPIKVQLLKLFIVFFSRDLSRETWLEAGAHNVNVILCLAFDRYGIVQQVFNFFVEIRFALLVLVVVFSV